MRKTKVYKRTNERTNYELSMFAKCKVDSRELAGQVALMLRPIRTVPTTAK